MHNLGSMKLLYNYLITSMILLEGGRSLVKNFGGDFNLTLYSFLGIQVSNRYTTAEFSLSLCSLN